MSNTQALPNLFTYLREVAAPSFPKFEDDWFDFTVLVDLWHNRCGVSRRQAVQADWDTRDQYFPAETAEVRKWLQRSQELWIYGIKSVYATSFGDTQSASRFPLNAPPFSSPDDFLLPHTAAWSELLDELQLAALQGVFVVELYQTSAWKLTKFTTKFRLRQHLPAGPASNTPTVLQTALEDWIIANEAALAGLQLLELGIDVSRSSTGHIQCQRLPPPSTATV